MYRVICPECGRKTLRIFLHEEKDEGHTKPFDFECITCNCYCMEHGKSQKTRIPVDYYVKHLKKQKTVERELNNENLAKHI